MSDKPAESALKQEVRRLYYSRLPRAVWFRYGLIAFDFASILFFLAAAAYPQSRGSLIAGGVIGVIILLDFLARLWVAGNRWRMLRRLYTLADIVVVASLLVAPLLTEDVTVLSILRGVRLLQTYRLMRDLRRDSTFFRQREDTVVAAVNLFVFIFVTTSLAYALFFNPHTGPSAYVDALYFTVATLTTTGYGDITLNTTGGKVFSVLVMVVGVALFVQLARAMFQPSKVKYECPECGLNRHDPDAVHCKHCGAPVKIPTAGFSD
ncbi:MAG: ion transporter [Rhodobacteraceae bacterium]|nr:ion transporter [Paracoccaceae bacterium]